MITAKAAHARLSHVHWPTGMAYVTLNDAGIIGPETLDGTATKATLLSTQSMEYGLYKEICRITFRDKAAQSTEVLTSNKPPNEECLMSTSTSG